MKYLFTLLFLASVHLAQAQTSLLLGGMRAATQLGGMAARNSKAKAKVKTNAVAEETPASAPVVIPTPTSNSAFTYQGQSVARQRTAPGTLSGKGSAEIMALEAVLEQTHQALLADSAQSFMPAAQLDAIRTAARQAAAARPSWDYSAYHHEVAFYQREEARRTAPAPVAKPKPKPRGRK
ncbi:hypothetical protein [Hymenobacter actinosclerus]|uniref:Uncharacterized protein n=1 Tax=Hymenobacter actinosclerus TaxID=82805 RepID=A0A1I0EB50_9BACT|nr:hypothetical protein [Hymenobacter actinosclerus]SET42287.1 hypothetical protein SAMN04487998_1768 [Hymenobacter actinosclerus]